MNQSTLVQSGSIKLIIDEEDIATATSHGWCLNGTGYVVAYLDGRVVLLGRLLTGAPDDMVVVHFNDDKMDFRRENLRVVDRSTMVQRQKKRAGTTSKYKGVQRHAKSGRWRAILWVGDIGRNIHLGYFEKEIDAARAYDIAARNYYGEDAWVNLE